MQKKNEVAKQVPKCEINSSRIKQKRPTWIRHSLGITWKLQGRSLMNLHRREFHSVNATTCKSLSHMITPHAAAAEWVQSRATNPTEVSIYVYIG